MKKVVYFMFSILWKLYIKKYKPVVIWVTWSVGKTSSRMIIYQVLKQFLPDKKIYTSPKNFNSELWLVFSIYALEKYKPSLKNLIKVFFLFSQELIFWKKKYDIIVLEYGIDHPWDMDFLLKIAKPDYSVFTKLDYIHVQNFKSKEDIWKEKIKLIKATKNKAFLNQKDEFLEKESKNLKVKHSFFNKKDSFKHKYFVENDKILSLLKFKDDIVKTNILWEENFVYIGLALKILKEFWVKHIDKNQTINLINQPWRFTLFNWVFGSVLIDSTYNAWPASMIKMIENAVTLRDKVFKKYELLFVIWDMRELWKKSRNEHRKLYHYLSHFWKIISVWKETKNHFWDHLWNFEKSSDAWKYLYNFLETSSKKYLVLFKWSQNTIFTEEALKQVLKNENSKKMLVRQDDYWMKQKN